MVLLWVHDDSKHVSIYIQPHLFVRIEQYGGDRAPQPLPLESGFSKDRVYEILGIHTPSETAEAYLVLRNDRDELWFISNRHVRVVDRMLRYDSKSVQSPGEGEASLRPGGKSNGRHASD
jgi:hypothetical protein